MKDFDWQAWGMMRDYAPSFKHQFNRKWRTCGSVTLSLLTGKSPSVIESHLPATQKHWSTRAMAKYINDKTKFEALVLRPDAVVANMHHSRWNNPSIGAFHTVLLNCRTDREDASWFLYHRQAIYHNFDREESDQLFLFRRPPQYMILVRKKL